MADIKVSYIQGLVSVVTHLEDGGQYKFSDIAGVLKKDYSLINDNQISGLINKMSNASVFERIKEDGKRICYVFSEQAARKIITANNPFTEAKRKKEEKEKKEKEEGELKLKIKEILERSCLEIDLIPMGLMKNEDDFKLLQKVKQNQLDLISELNK